MKTRKIRRIRRIKDVLKLILLAACLLPVLRAVTISAANSEASSVYIKAEYSDNITPQKGDVFILTYNADGGTQSAEIQVDAYTIQSDYGVIEMPASAYDITAIEYTGKNEDILNDNYGVLDGFVAGDGLGNRTIIYLAVGEYEVSVLRDDYANIIEHNPPPQEIRKTYVEEMIEKGLMEDEYAYLDEQVSSGVVSETAEEAEETVYEESKVLDENYGVEEQTGTGEEPQVEHYNVDQNQKDDAKGGGIPVKLGILAVLLVVGLGVIYALWYTGFI